MKMIYQQEGHLKWIAQSKMGILVFHCDKVVSTRKASWACGLGGGEGGISFSSVVGTTTTEVESILLNYSIEYVTFVCASCSIQRTLGRLCLMPFPAATAGSKNFTINRGQDHVAVCT